MNLNDSNFDTIENAIRLHQNGYLQEAEDIYTKILQKSPDNPDALHLMGVIFCQTDKNDMAVQYIKRAINFAPEAHYFNSLGLAYLRQGKTSEAKRHFEESLRQCPDADDVYNNLGQLFQSRGEIKNAIECFKSALKLNHTNIRYYSNLLLCLNYSIDIDKKTIFNECCNWEKLLDTNLTKYSNYKDESKNKQNFKIGYVSSDFCIHPVGFFIEAVLANHSNKFTTICYSGVTIPDKRTEKIKKLCNHWFDISQMNDFEIAKLIYEHGIDILVDLTGHFAQNYLMVFAQKPAPVQAHYLGYPNTTGLSQIDYRITDKFADSSDSQAYFSEELIFMPGSFLCYTPPDEKCEILDLPALKNGYITFGSFNNISKINDYVIDVYSEILKAVPDSKLIIKSKSFADLSTVNIFKDLFKKHQISENRIDFLGFDSNISNHLDQYNSIDISLDTFPYNGTTTTCESLWMGVPTITMAGDIHASRVGVSILNSAGLVDFIAASKKHYVDIAVNLSNNLDFLQKLRKALRNIVNTSALTNGKNFIKNLEDAYMLMWNKKYNT